MTEPSDHLKRHYRTWGKPTKPPSPAIGVFLRCAFFLIIVFGLLFVVLMAMDDRGSPDLLVAGSLTIRVIGGFVAILGATGVAVQAAQGDKLASLAPWVVTTLVGVLIIEPSGGVGIALGAVVSALIIREAIRPRPEPAGESQDE